MARYYCCWCKSHLDAAKFIGITYLVLHLVVLGVWLAILEGAVPDGQITDYVYPSNDAFLRAMIHGGIGTCATLMLVDFGLIFGCSKKIGCLLITWLVVTAIYTLGFGGVIIWMISTSFTITLWLVGIAITLVNIRAIFNVSMAVREINQEKRNAVSNFAGQKVASNPEIKCIT